MSSVGLPVIEIPMSSEWPSLSNVLAAWITALDGMQPTLRHTPPMYSRSMMAVLTLSCPSRIAAGYPPGPAPMTTASKRCSGMGASYHADDDGDGDGAPVVGLGRRTRQVRHRPRRQAAAE